VTIGFFPNGAPAEAFISNHKVGNASDVMARDAGILISLLLQCGCTAETIAKSISRNGNGSPSSVISTVLDLIVSLSGETCPKSPATPIDARTEATAGRPAGVSALIDKIHGTGNRRCLRKSPNIEGDPRDETEYQGRCKD
jgi:hypothetical protein